MHDKKIEIFLWAFYTHWLWNEQYIIISWILPTFEVNLYKIFNSYWTEEEKFKLWKYFKILNNKELIDKINMFWKKWGYNFNWLRKWDILHPKWRAHFYYAINVDPIIIEYSLWDKIIMFKILEVRDWFQLSYKLRNSVFETKNFRGETIKVARYGGSKWFPHKIIYEWLSYIYSREHGLQSEIEKWWFENLEKFSTMDDVLLCIEKIIKEYNKSDILYWDWNKEYEDDSLPF